MLMLMVMRTGLQQLFHAWITKVVYPNVGQATFIQRLQSYIALARIAGDTKYL